MNERQEKLLGFTRKVLEILHEQPVFQRRRFFHGQPIEGEGAPDIAWLNPDGNAMTAESWNAGFSRCLGVVLFGDSIDVDEHGEEIQGDTLLMLFNADHANTIAFTLPPGREGEHVLWQRLLDTADDGLDETILKPGECYDLRPCSVAILRYVEQPAEAVVPAVMETVSNPELASQAESAAVTVAGKA